MYLHAHLVIRRRQRAQTDFATVGELDGVGEEVAEDLTHAQRVAAEAALQLRGNLHLERQTARDGQDQVGLLQRAQLFDQVKGHALDQLLAGLDLGQIQDVRDDGGQ